MIPVAVTDVGDFVAVADTIVHPILNRVARARDAVLLACSPRPRSHARDEYLALLALAELEPLAP